MPPARQTTGQGHFSRRGQIMQLPQRMTAAPSLASSSLGMACLRMTSLGLSARRFLRIRHRKAEHFLVGLWSVRAASSAKIRNASGVGEGSIVFSFPTGREMVTSSPIKRVMVCAIPRMLRGHHAKAVNATGIYTHNGDLTGIAPSAPTSEGGLFRAIPSNTFTERATHFRDCSPLRGISHTRPRLSPSGQPDAAAMPDLMASQAAGGSRVFVAAQGQEVRQLHSNPHGPSSPVRPMRDVAGLAATGPLLVVRQGATFFRSSRDLSLTSRFALEGAHVG